MMVALDKLKPVDRRDFLKRGIQSGMVLVSLPLWKNTPWGRPATLLDAMEASAALVSKEDLRTLLEAALSRGGDFAEVYCEHTVQNSLSLDEDKISTATSGLDAGAGFRVVKGEKTGYAFSDDLDPARLKEAALAAAMIADGRTSARPRAFKTLAPPSFYLVETAPDGVAAKLKADLLYKANAAGRGFDNRITQFRAGFSDTTKRITIANSEGLYVEDIQTLTSLGTTALALEGKLRAMGYESKAGSFGFEHFDARLAQEFGRKTAEMAVRNLPAEDAPAGEFPIVIARGYGGIFFHEAIGHSLEADGIRKKTSVFWDKLGKPIATPVVTLLDDGTYKGGWGSVNVDDEGQPGRKTVLIDGGTCTAFLQDKLSAGLMKMQQTGNGRRQSFRFYPIPRMTNTYLLPGQSDPADIVKSIDRGVYISKIGGGNVDWTTGRFVFSVTEGSMIEGGRVTKPLKGLMLMGTGQDVLKNISLVGNDLLVIGGGGCGKSGQGKPVGFGNPTLKVDRITVGGQRA
jgi:TldD protein